ncbi:type I methionyl aminopeptidase [Candidatus Gracilibacteria bacterium]|nr:MAG: type I methionyl aminopeptidase [Candidatus Gracilibacteria bacterium]
MLNNKEIEQLRKNALVHKKVFEEIKKTVKVGTSAEEIDKLCGHIAKENNVLCGFKGVYDFPANICISVNDCVVHGVPRKGIIFKKGDLVKFDFGIKDKKYGVNTDAAISIIIGGDHTNEVAARLIETSKKALYAGIEKAKDGNRVGDISSSIQQEVEGAGFKIIKELSGHGIGYNLHEKPYIYNYGKAGTGQILKEGMTIAIEPIIGETSGEIYDKGSWEIYVKDGSLGCQFEHTVLITSGDAEIII